MNSKFFTVGGEQKLGCAVSRNANELPPASPDKLRDHLYPRVATAKIYTTELSYYSSGGKKNLDGQKAKKRKWEMIGEQERERERAQGCRLSHILRSRR